MSDEVSLPFAISSTSNVPGVGGSLTISQGASPRELLLEAARRNNTSLLSEVLSSQSSPGQKAQLLNESTDGLGNHSLHLAANYGSCTSIFMMHR